MRWSPKASSVHGASIRQCKVDHLAPNQGDDAEGWLTGGKATFLGWWPAARGWSHWRQSCATGTALGSHSGGERGMKRCWRPSSLRGDLGGSATLTWWCSGEGDGAPVAPRATPRHGGDPRPTRGGREPVRSVGNGEPRWKNRGRLAVTLIGGKMDGRRGGQEVGGPLSRCVIEGGRARPTGLGVRCVSAL
jgi:hypothetical protein